MRPRHRSRGGGRRIVSADMADVVCASSDSDVSRHPPRTVADPSRPRLRQWVAVSAASETACRRAAVHLPACLATGGGAPPDESGVRSAASWLTRCASCAPLPQPTPSGCPDLGVVQPPGGARPWVWPHGLGGVSRHPPGTAADPPRPRLRQWVAVSAASETACRRTALHRSLESPPPEARLHLTSPACARRQAGSLAARVAPHCRSPPPRNTRA